MRLILAISYENKLLQSSLKMQQSFCNFFLINNNITKCICLFNINWHWECIVFFQTVSKQIKFQNIRALFRFLCALVSPFTWISRRAWKCPKPGWIRLGTTGCSRRRPGPWQWIGTGLYLGSLQPWVILYTHIFIHSYIVFQVTKQRDSSSLQTEADTQRSDQYRAYDTHDLFAPFSHTSFSPVRAARRWRRLRGQRWGRAGRSPQRPARVKLCLPTAGPSRSAHAGWGRGGGAAGGAAGRGGCEGSACHGAGPQAPCPLRWKGTAEEAPRLPSAWGGCPGQPGRCLPDMPAAPVRERGAARARAPL